MFQPDIGLNVLWALFCAAAVVYHIRAERLRRSGSPQARIFRGVALFLAVVSLFPCVSASDDSVRYEYLDTNQSTPAKPHSAPAPRAPEKSHVMLVRMLEALESVQVPLIWAFSITLCFFALVCVEWRRSLDRFLPRSTGRDPPLSLLFA